MQRTTIVNKAERVLDRPDGSQVRVVAEAMYGLGLHLSIGYYAHHRASQDEPWRLISTGSPVKDPTGGGAFVGPGELMRTGGMLFGGK